MNKSKPAPIADIIAKSKKITASKTESPVALKTDEATASQPHEAEIPYAAPAKGELSAPVKRTSTSLYLTPAAHQAIRVHAATRGVRPHRIYDEALKAYFEAKGLGDFDKLNSIGTRESDKA